MSDVSGIPYMGPMGQGNFFAPQFSYNPQLSAGAIQSNYMPEAIQGQNVFNNLYGGGANAGFGRLTDYYSGLGASYSAASGSSNPYGVFSDSGRGGGGGGGASPYQTSPSVWDTGASPFLGGGGSSGFGGSIYNTPSIDWGGVGQAAAGLQQSSRSPFDFNVGLGGGMFGGLGGSGATPGAGQLDWSHMFGGGGARQDPAPGMSMPGGLNQPMAPPQQQPLDYGSLFGQGVGGTGGAPQPPSYTSGIAPDETGGRTFGERFDALGGSEPMTADPSPGMTMPGGLNSPMTVPAQQQPTDFGSLFGQSVGGTSQPWPADSYNPSNDQPSDPRMDKPLPGNPYTDPQGGGVSAADLGEQARQKLAELVAKPVEPAMDPNAPPAEAIPLPQPRPEGADAPAAEPPATPPYPLQPAEKPAALPEGASRPPGDIKQGTGLRDSPTLKGVNPRLVAAVAGGSTFLPPGYTVEAVSGVREGKSQSYHSGGRAADFKIIGPDGKAIPHKGEDTTGMYTMLAQGVKTWTQQNDPVLAKQLGYGGAFGTQLGGGGVPDLMHYDLGGSRGRMVPDVQFGNLRPLSAEEQRASLGSQIASGIAAEGQRYAEGPNAPLAERSAQATVEERPGVNQGQAISSPPANIPDARLSGEGFNALDAAANAPAAVKHSGLELARANIDTPIEKIAMERGGQKAVDQVSSMAVGMTPRQLMQSYGGMFMSRAEPLFQSLGITRQDFEKATSMPPTRQDLKMRFGGDFGGMGGELPTAGSFSPYPGFRESADFENRTAEQLSRGQLAKLQTQGASYEPLPEVAPTPLGTALGLEDIGRVSGDTGMRDFQSPANDYSAFQTGWGNPFIRTGGGQPDWDSGGQVNPYTGQPGTSFYPGSQAFNLGKNYSYPQQQADLQFQRAPLGRQLEDDPAKQSQLIATVYSELGPNPTDRDIAALIESLANRTVAVGGSDIAAGGMLYPESGKKQYYEGFIPGGSAKETEAYRETESNPEFQSRVWDIARQVLYGGSNVADLPTDNASAGVPAIDTRNPAGWGQTLNYVTQPFPGGPEFYLRKDNPVPGLVPSGRDAGTSTRNFVGGPNVDAIQRWYAAATGKPWAPAASPPWPGSR